MSGVAQRSDLVGGVQRAELRALRDADHTGLRVVLYTQMMRLLAELLRDQLGRGRGERQQFGAEHSLWCAGLVHRDVRPLGADDTVRWAQQSRERHDVRSSAVPHEVGLCSRPEEVAESRLRLKRPTIVAVGQRVAIVRRADRVHHRGVGAGGVVTGERPQRGDGHLTRCRHIRSVCQGARRTVPTYDNRSSEPPGGKR